MAEIEATNVAAAADPKAKKAAAPSKGQKAPEEQLKDELDEITKVKPEGFILLDFPKNLNQAKLLENAINGFKAMTDSMKDPEMTKYEEWSKLAAPSLKTKASEMDQSIKSSFDGVVFLDVDSEECVKRSEGRRIDPQTQQIYH